MRTNTILVQARVERERERERRDESCARAGGSLASPHSSADRSHLLACHRHLPHLISLEFQNSSSIKLTHRTRLRTSHSADLGLGLYRRDWRFWGNLTEDGEEQQKEGKEDEEKQEEEEVAGCGFLGGDKECEGFWGADLGIRGGLVAFRVAGRFGGGFWFWRSLGIWFVW